MPEKYLDAGDFDKALKRLDRVMAEDEYLYAFSPIDIITTGGFLAVNYFKNRKTTGDLDYFVDPQYIDDEDIIRPLNRAIETVARKNELEYEWMNDSMKIWMNGEARHRIFRRAMEQNILLWEGDVIRVWAAPFEWALERKLRRIAYSANRGDKQGVDMSDAIALFRHFRKAKGGPLNMEYYRTLNMNGFDVEPEVHHMKRVAARYKEVYNEELFNLTTPTTAAAEAYYTALPATSAAGPSRTADEAQEDLTDEYYFVQDEKYYRCVNGKAVRVERPQQTWVYNEKGWKDTGRQKKWRYAAGSNVSYR